LQKGKISKAVPAANPLKEILSLQVIKGMGRVEICKRKSWA